MIPLNELQLGNHVQVMLNKIMVDGRPRFGTIFTISENESVTVRFHDGNKPSTVDTDINHIHGIYPTKEWLVNAGFKSISDNQNWELFERNGFTVDVSSQDNTFLPSYNGANIGRCEYIHRIQNFYFKSMGEKLYG